MTEMRIEIARPGDAAEAASLVRDISRATYEDAGEDVRRWAQTMSDAGIWDERIKRPGSVVLAARNAGDIVGVVWVACLEPGRTYAADGYLGGLYVALPGRGIGRSLVCHAERHAALSGCRALLAEALHGGAGHRMLCRMGWRERGRHAGRIVAGPVWVELVRELDLTHADDGV
ncbi:MAG TPA: GNAT family N-acetyltransferase [Solirubrobacteraceae bacterium]|jgi:predicted N-acetyltransferase YhbS|nr:GNAT family N-acetyltransferase [Solirubrobacteraceae bacterium]